MDTGFLDGIAEAPRLIRAGRFIARPKRYIRGYAREIEVADLPRVAAEEARAGDGWVKIIADWIDRDAGDLTPLWPADVLAEAIAAAHAEGARVTAHTFATESIDALLDAGIDCIEHGTGMTREQLARAAVLGVPVVPTLLQVANFESFAAQGEAKFPRYASRMRAHVRAALRAGATRCGRRVCSCSPAPTPAERWATASLPAECAELAHAGIPRSTSLPRPHGARARFSASTASRRARARTSWSIRRDPREDISVLAHPSAIILRGERVA